ncbi:MAG: hypothetical protein ABIF71_13275 [Planctomycetota bacterium]
MTIVPVATVEPKGTQSRFTVFPLTPVIGIGPLTGAPDDGGGMFTNRPNWGDPDFDRDPRPPKNPEIPDALKWLKRHQAPDGSWSFANSDFLIPIRNRSCFSEKGLALFSTHR